MNRQLPSRALQALLTTALGDQQSTDWDRRTKAAFGARAGMLPRLPAAWALGHLTAAPITAWALKTTFETSIKEGGRLPLSPANNPSCPRAHSGDLC